MAKQKEYVVRVVQMMDDNGNEICELGKGKVGLVDFAFLESLRYAGLIHINKVPENSLTVNCFDLRCPHGLVSKVWAEQNAERMRSFGFNAVAAPSTR